VLAEDRSECPLPGFALRQGAAARQRPDQRLAAQSRPAVDLAARADIADFDDPTIAIDGEDDAQCADPCGAASARSGKRFRVWAKRVLGDLVEPGDDALLRVAWDSLEIALS